ncbi:MAG: phosphatidylserine/phosphatidylglycerophosphate/cardiolipin synthase family protein [Myxococcales bacterium]|nr:phosphatidylserine/phosphatidylglycerophosphate/cardiolipin synthase family protein [Myxococcales bacterium]MCB9538053.1 phosphatidylserine/phosphatidylglycerophosphate/cardiolipin synthase family protein [Myxococcales bacterium]
MHPYDSSEGQAWFDQHTHSIRRDDTHAELLINGGASFPVRYRLMAEARHSIHLQTLVFAPDDTGWLHARLLVAKARGEAFDEPHPYERGARIAFPAGPPVQVRVITDQKSNFDAGSDVLSWLEDRGVPVLRYMPDVTTAWHAKMLVVDGQTAITGGQNVASEYAYGGTMLIDDSGGSAKIPWRDTDILLRGDIVRDMQWAFCRSWDRITGDKLMNDRALFPAPEAPGSLPARFAHQWPREFNTKSVTNLYIGAIQNAQRSIRIANAYFIPDERMVWRLVDAVKKRGVSVEILTNSPESNDFPFMSVASRRSYPTLIEAGVKVYERKGEGVTMHQKVATFDGVASIVGTWNFDERSARSNSECAVMVHDGDFATEVETMFRRDLVAAYEVTRGFLDQRDLWDKLQEAFWGTGVVRDQL